MKILLLLFSFTLFAQTKIPLNLQQIQTNLHMSFITHVSSDKKSFDNALAMNIRYAPVKRMRKLISKAIGKDLDFFKGWKLSGEAHVTVITPPEFVFHLSKFMTINDINNIARKNIIQKSDLSILGIGSGKKLIDGKEEETFFLIVESKNLRKIRHDIYELFVKKGGSPRDFDPTWFFPHITIGYTKKDLHESDGVIKNLKHSFDPRFKLVSR